jgi:hypothetical protein
MVLSLLDPKPYHWRSDVMKSLKKVLAASAAWALGLAAISVTPAGAAPWSGPPAPYAYYGGSTAVFNTQVFATLASLVSVEGVFRLCATGAGTPTGNTCGLTAATGGLGAPIASAQENFIVISGIFKNSTTDPQGLGIPGGGPGTAFISSNGSSYGVECTSAPYTGANSLLGTLGLFGKDNVPGTADDAGGVGVFAVNPTGIPANWAAGGPNAFAPLVSCPGGSGIAGLEAKLVAPFKPTDNTAANASEFCVLDYGTNIQAEPAGQAQATYSISNNGTATSNISLPCNLGVSDVPPADFANPLYNTLHMDGQVNIGAQIFKIIANTNVAPTGSFFAGDVANKIALQIGGLEGVFGGSNQAQDACSWDDVGGQVVGSPASGNVDHDAIEVCYREDGSGTRATFINTWDVTKYGTQDVGTPSNVPGTLVTQACSQFLQGAGGGLANGGSTNKYFFGPNTSTGSEATCVLNATGGAGKGGGVGYVTASTKDTANPLRYYSVPVYGIDPDAYSAAQLQELVKCGEYPYWAPSTLGIRATSPAATVPLTSAQSLALQTVGIFTDTNSPDYIPAGDFQSGIALIKTRVNNIYNTQFQSLNCDANVPFAPMARP